MASIQSPTVSPGYQDDSFLFFKKQLEFGGRLPLDVGSI